MSFIDLKIIPSLLKAITDQGYTKPTPIQLQAIPAILAKRDVLGCAQTGTGKTAAFGVPLLQLMLERQTAQQRQIRTLVLAPTRELAMQITEALKSFSRYTDFRCAAIFGGVPMHPQVQAIRRGIDVLVATPGRLKDLIRQGLISLKQVQYLVLDEADHMLDMGFIQDVKHIISHVPANRQTLLFSATMPPRIIQLAKSLLNNPVRIEVTPVSTTAERVEQFVYFAEKQHKQTLLKNIFETEAIETAIVFTQMKHMADKLCRFLNGSGIAAEAIHGNKSQRQREKALENFKTRQTRVLVATDIAARGIDVDKLSHVINYELPQTPETYLHRIGRTGRAGSAGTAISICSSEEKSLLADIHKLTKTAIPVATMRLPALSARLKPVA